MPTVNGHDKRLDPHRKPEHQTGLSPIEAPSEGVRPDLTTELIKRSARSPGQGNK